MADSHEEQLLNDLLRGIAREDERLSAPHLEARVVAAVGAEDIARRRPMSPYLVIAAVLVSVVLVSALYRTQPSPAEAPVSRNTAVTEVAIPDKPVKPVVQTKPVEAPARMPVPASTAQLPNTQSIAELPVAQSRAIAQPSVTQSPDEFMLLMPLTPQELSGSFQIVRVQMPRASLGALRSPLEQPNELVEADVLLGEDGVARGIRLAASGSVSPWRSR